VTKAVLGDYVDLQRGNTYKSALLEQPGPVLLGLASIARNGGFRRDSLRTYGGESDERMLLRPGDIYVSLKDVTQSADLLGAVACVPPDVGLGRLTQDTVKLNFRNGSEPERRYVYWALRGPDYREYCRSRAIGTTNLSLARDDFLGFPIRPPAASDFAVVELLDALDDRIDLNRRLNQTLEAMAQALFKSWFVDFDPVRAKAEGRQPVSMDAETGALFPSSFASTSLGESPTGWSTAVLGQFISLDKGVSYKGEFLTKRGLPMVNLKCIRPHGGFNADGLKPYSGPVKEKHHVHPGDVVVANTDITQARNVLGAPARVPPTVGGDLVFSHHTWAARHRPHSPLGPNFIYQLLLTEAYRERARGFATGTTVLALPPDAVLELSFALPPQEIINSFERTVQALTEMLWAHDAQSLTLRRVRDLLLPKLLSGELRVKDAEATVATTV